MKLNCKPSQHTYINYCVKLPIYTKFKLINYRKFKSINTLTYCVLGVQQNFEKPTKTNCFWFFFSIN